MALRTKPATHVTSRLVFRLAQDTPRSKITYKFAELPEGLRRTSGIKDVFPKPTFTLDDLLKYAEANPKSTILDLVALYLYVVKKGEHVELERPDRLVLIEWIGGNLAENRLAQALISLRHPTFFANRNLDEKIRIATCVGQAAGNRKVQTQLGAQLHELGQKISGSCISTSRFSSLATVSEGLWADYFNIASFLPDSPFKEGMRSGLPVGTVVVREREPRRAAI